MNRSADRKSGLGSVERGAPVGRAAEVTLAGAFAQQGNPGGSWPAYRSRSDSGIGA